MNADGKIGQSFEWNEIKTSVPIILPRKSGKINTNILTLAIFCFPAAFAGKHRHTQKFKRFRFFFQFQCRTSGWTLSYIAHKFSLFHFLFWQCIEYRECRISILFRFRYVKNVNWEISEHCTVRKSKGILFSVRKKWTQDFMN